MRNQFDRQLNNLNGELIQMGHMIEQAIEHAIEAMVHRDVEKARKNMEFDAEIDQQEKDIEGLCMKLLMKQQPVARDLRLISAALKMITDMERIGDQAADISELSICLSDVESLPKMDIIQKMAQESMLMVVKSIEAFVSKDLETAEKVIKRDDVIDNLFVEAKAELIRLIQEKSACAEVAADLLMVAKYFERIGDHATNIAEWVIYSINGKHALVQQNNDWES
ncbi:MAG: phosphate signaling complex protein PhoU [Eubacterium sp.]